MSVQAKPGMNVDAFLAWAEGQPGRHELLDGEVVAKSPERVRHAEIKFAVQLALRSALRVGDLPCRMLPDGLSVRIDDRTVFEPDALVYCGEPLDPDAIAVPAPLIVIEVLSPRTKGIDTGIKLDGYFRLPSVMHYLIVDPKRRTIIHHRRVADDLIETRIAAGGMVDLDPPGLSLPLATLFDG